MGGRSQDRRDAHVEQHDERDEGDPNAAELRPSRVSGSLARRHDAHISLPPT